MRRLTRSRPSPALSVAFLALFVALCGTAVAAKGLITGDDIAKSTITGKNVKNRSLAAKDFKRGQLPRGARGPQGQQGVAGPAGRAGVDGFGVLSYESADALLEPTEEGGRLDADCPAGQYPTGGDAFAYDESDALLPEMILAQLYHLGPDDRPQGWRVYVSDNEGTEDVTVIVDVICANAAPPAPQSIAAGARPHVAAGHRRLN